MACTMGDFRVAVLGRGSEGFRKAPWTVYSYPEQAGWGQHHLPRITKDFFAGDHGIVFSNWDISRLTWLPAVQGRNWDAWLYAPVDHTGPDGQRLGIECRNALPLFNRVMAPSEWGADVLKRSGRPDADWLPHGIFFNTFRPIENARALLNWDQHSVVAGCVMTNQSRKDWAVAFEAFAMLKSHYGNRFRAWVHTDSMIRHWNIYALAADYEMADCLEVTMDKSDEEMALHYSGCDVTILPSSSEGFGFTIAESLACGTPCVVTDYAAGQELVEIICRVPPVTYRVDTIYNVTRAVLSGYGFANACYAQIENSRADRAYHSERLRETVSHLDWSKLKFSWMRWFRDGLHG